MAELAVSAVLSNISTLGVVQNTTPMLCGNRFIFDVKFLKDELKRLQGFVRDADSKRRQGNGSVDVLVRKITDVAYKADDLIEAVDYKRKRNMKSTGFRDAIARYAAYICTRRSASFEMQSIKREISRMIENANRLEIVDMGSNSIENVHRFDEFSQHLNFEDVVVGFEDEYKEIVRKLVDTGNKTLSVVSIVAMGGAGKTALARKVYTSSSVRQHFETTIWVTVSKGFKDINMLKDIMEQIFGAKYESTAKMNEFEMRNKIHDLLLRKKYLVVLDDVWETDTWDQLNGMEVFPDASNSSRVLLTTRKEDVANIVPNTTYVHYLKKLDEEKSWELFSCKALPSYRRSDTHGVDEFEYLGKKLAKKCDGLPLALAVLGSYLSKKQNSQTWSRILSELPSTDKIHMVQYILSRIYEDMPNPYLRSCLLHLAAFPKDYIISVSDLIELWIAESFIPHISRHMLEETAIARNFVTMLAQRSLVQVVGRSKAHGWIETIRIYGMIHDWCKEKARQDGFLEVIHKTIGQAGVSLQSDNLIFYRSSFQTLSGQTLEATPRVRTLLGFQLESVSFPELKFLRVIHIENSTLKYFSGVIGGCIHLRCLRLANCGDVTLPSSIDQLLYLQTIDLRGTRLDSKIPKSLWNIFTLRHVYLGNEFSPPRRPPCAKSVRQDRKELQTFQLHVPVAGNKYRNHDMVVFLGQMNQLTTLYLRMHRIPPKVINILANLPHLVDISLNKFGVLDKLPTEFPQGLRSLVLHADVIKQDPMPILEKLICLMVLKLWGYKGRTMSCSAQGFPRLLELELCGCSTEEWIIKVGAMPKLTRMVLEPFEKMSKFPEELLGLPSLNNLVLGPVLYNDVYPNNAADLQRKGCKVYRWRKSRTQEEDDDEMNL